ncbi:MAG: hypothetical protein WBG66_14715 [Geitlerinemataceae cyanobacterium]
MNLAICTPRILAIDAPGQIAQTPILPLRCVDALWGLGLRAVVANFAESIYTYCQGVRRFDARNSRPVWSARRTPYRLG